MRWDSSARAETHWSDGTTRSNRSMRRCSSHGISSYGSPFEEITQRWGREGSRRGRRVVVVAVTADENSAEPTTPPSGRCANEDDRRRPTSLSFARSYLPASGLSSLRSTRPTKAPCRIYLPASGPSKVPLRRNRRPGALTFQPCLEATRWYARHNDRILDGGVWCVPM